MLTDLERSNLSLQVQVKKLQEDVTQAQTIATQAIKIVKHSDCVSSQQSSLWPEEWHLLHHLMMGHQDGFAWTDAERGQFHEDFFPPVKIPTIPHTPWVLCNIPILPGI